MIWPLSFSQGRPAQLTSTLIDASAGLCLTLEMNYWTKLSRCGSAYCWRQLPAARILKSTTAILQLSGDILMPDHITCGRSLM